ncbi:MAG: ABC transporter permease [Terriglobales bacterium]
MAIAEQTPPTRLKPEAHPPRLNGRWSGFSHLLMARMKELVREPELIFWIFGFPILLAAGLGIAFRNKPAEATSIAVASGPGAEQAVNWIQHSPQASSIHVQILDQSQALQAFHLGKYDLVLEPDGQGRVRYIYDPARPETMLARAKVDDALQEGAGRKNPVPVSSFASSEPGSRYIDFLIPGLLGMTLMNSGMWGVGFALVDMRQRKLLKRFVATPMRKSDFLLALAGSRLVLMLVDVGLLLGLGVLAFKMRVLGSLLTIVFLGALGSIAFGGLGLLTACRAKKIETVSGLINLVMMPMWIFSGVFFSYEHFPARIQPFIKALPLTALNDALRTTILQGASLSSQSGRILELALWGGISFVLALKWFRWT